MKNIEQVVNCIKKYNQAFHPVVSFDPAKEKLLQMDFTAGNKELTIGLLGDTDLFIRYINKKLQNAGAKFGIGGYAEQRTIYSQSKVFDATATNEEPRRLHLGVDIWGKPHTPVMAPCDGIVHSFAFNNNFGDYGATIILSHHLDGFSFYTLYGHLSLSDIKNLGGGERIEKGEVFAEFGIPTDNGYWPPHLHFQLIINIENYSGDYPGVCAHSEKEKFLANCPDPDMLLQLNQYLR